MTIVDKRDLKSQPIIRRGLEEIPLAKNIKAEGIKLPQPNSCKGSDGGKERI